MSAEAHRSVNGETGEAPEEAALARVLESYLAGLEAGRPVDPDRLIADHPELAGPLRACLKVMHLAAGLSGAAGRRGEEIAAPPGTSALTMIWPHDDSFTHRLLPEPPGDDAPLLRVDTDRSPDGPGTGRYQVLGEIARGGMGVVLKARDVDLGRDLALKVLQTRHHGDPGVVGRFVEEARIGGQLQHPGIVPVHELGTLADRRPYFTMKLVRGRTLAALLAERSGQDADLPRFLTIFEQVCQTVAYAHARRVIHRDLKPANVMVGSFGEVQVVDWGLAKVLPQGGVADEARAMTAETEISTARSGPAGSDVESQPGSVLGTPSYMAPEQARGEIDRIDERADVFGLGAILCEVLTGRPPFGGSSRQEIRARAALGDLADAIRRLDAREADAELIGLARDCLAADVARRPRDAGEVARRISAYRAGVQDRLRAAELARVAAQARVEEERKRRRVTVALAASVLGLVILGGGGWAYLARQRTERLLATTRVVTEALAEAERFRGQAQSAAGDLTKWAEAIGAARRARDLLAAGESDEALRTRLTTALGDLEREQAAVAQQVAEAERDRKLLAELEAIRNNRSETGDRNRLDAQYAAAFRNFGVDLDQLDPEEAGRRIARRSVAVELAAQLDNWAWQRRWGRDDTDDASWHRLLAAAQAADPDPWRAALRERIRRRDLEAIRKLADDAKTLEAQPVHGLIMLTLALKNLGDPERGQEVARRTWRLYPGDFWANFERGRAEGSWGSHPNPKEAVRCFSAAVALRPRSFMAHNNLAVAMSHLGWEEEEIAELREALRLKPDSSTVHINLGGVLDSRGKAAEAIAEFREALRLKPDSAMAHFNLAVSLGRQGKVDAAIAEYRAALRLKPEDATNHGNLIPKAHHNLGLILRSRGEYPEAIAELRKARDQTEADPPLLQRIERDLAGTERQASLAARLPAVLAGQAKPADADEMLIIAQLCNEKKRHGASARFWVDAFRLEPKLADDLQAYHRYNAACAAALAGCGQGRDDPPPDDDARTRWRRQAIEWLRADLSAWSKLLESGTPQARPSPSEFLRHWKADPDLAGLRDQTSLDKLPKDEQEACRALWKDVDALLAKAGGATP